MSKPLRIGIALVAVALLWLGARWIAGVLASDETKIRRAIEAACAGFDDARMGPVLDVLAPEFRDETSGVKREDLRGMLAGAFFQEKDPETKAFPYRAEALLDGATITVTPGEPDSAEVAFDARLYDTRGGESREAWAFHVDGRMEEREQGWCFVTTRYSTRAGSPRLRAR